MLWLLTFSMFHCNSVSLKDSSEGKQFPVSVKTYDHCGQLTLPFFVKLLIYQKQKVGDQGSRVLYVLFCILVECKITYLPKAECRRSRLSCVVCAVVHSCWISNVWNVDSITFTKRNFIQHFWVTFNIGYGNFTSIV